MIVAFGRFAVVIPFILPTLPRAAPASIAAPAPASSATTGSRDPVVSGVAAEQGDEAVARRGAVGDGLGPGTERAAREQAVDLRLDHHRQAPASSGSIAAGRPVAVARSQPCTTTSMSRCPQ